MRGAKHTTPFWGINSVAITCFLFFIKKILFCYEEKFLTIIGNELFVSYFEKRKRTKEVL